MTGGLVSALVQSIVKEGSHGAYAVATSPEITGSITFSLGSDVWQEDSLPEVGTWIVLFDLRKKRAGWRALKARFFRPSDEQAEPGKEQGSSEIVSKS